MMNVCALDCRRRPADSIDAILTIVIAARFSFAIHRHRATPSETHAFTHHPLERSVTLGGRVSLRARARMNERIASSRSKPRTPLPPHRARNTHHSDHSHNASSPPRAQRNAIKTNAPAHTCPNDAYSVLGSTLARVLTLAHLLVVETVTRETVAGRRSNPRGGTTVTARGVAAVTVVIIVADRSLDRGRAPRSSASGPERRDRR